MYSIDIVMRSRLNVIYLFTDGIFLKNPKQFEIENVVFLTKVDEARRIQFLFPLFTLSHRVSRSHPHFVCNLC